ncbi:Proline--tRNA ligase, cytoplasmic [Candida viswanathii]|uniref:proline--tRNA ligase n=1 Tax=Candida viswanathii TaxID=5486 RepID=A0A367YK16_9ASCO|nr:Proline--tRNA ligase, cytoplasmic [Candida viswanathii]
MIPRRFFHIKRVPKFHGSTLHSFKPSTSGVLPTHELLSKLGVVTYPRAGLVHWSKTGLLIQHKLSAVIRSRMDEVGFEELSLSLLSHRKLWEQTGRWGGTEIFKLVGDDCLLVPTAEEEITAYVKKHVESYKQLPVLMYQVNPKFRNEKRPRGGLLRGKEFLMKDAYSFDVDEGAAMSTYESVVGAYHRIFGDLRIPYVKAQADSGDIGGSLSHEWHYINGTGEDTVFKCDECGHASNVEKTLSFPQEVDESAEVSVRYFITTDKTTLVCAYYPSNRTLEPKFVQNEVPDLDLNETDQDAILKEFETEDLSKRVVRVMDARLNSRSNFPDFPIGFINRSLITTLTDVPIVLAQEGEICAQCEEGEITATNAIEVGHTFYLGDKYSKPLNFTTQVPKPDGTMEKQNVMMGCYGIGISRIIAAIAEINKDDKGLNWPRSIAPWEVTVVEVKPDGERSTEVCKILDDGQIDYRLDDRDERMGKRVADSNTMGIPLVVIMGKRYPVVEVEVRGKKYGDTWKQAYEEHKEQLDWHVEYDDAGNDVKHIVQKDGLATVVNSLLNDM